MGEGLADELDFDPRWRAATDIAELIAPVTAPLAQYLPSFRYLLLDLQRIGEQDPQSRDLVTSLGIVERDPTPENLQRVMRGLTRRFGEPEFAELHQALRSWVAGAAEAWQISEADLARMMSFPGSWKTWPMQIGSTRSSMRSSIVTAERSCLPACVRSQKATRVVPLACCPHSLRSSAAPTRSRLHARSGGRQTPRARPPAAAPPTDAGDSGRPHPLDELLFRAALEQCVSHTVDALRAA